MKMNHLVSSLVITSAVLGLSVATPVFAHSDSSHSQCDVSLNYDVTVEPKKLSISDKGNEKYRVELGKLYVEGKEVALNAKQQALLVKYSDEVSMQVPEVIELVNDAVIMASQAVSMALTPLLGDATGAKLDEMMDGVQKRIDEVAYRNGDKFYLGATESAMENAFDEEFEKEIEDLVQNSIGTIMMNIGSQMMSGEGGNFEEKMEAFGQKMENVGKDIETQMEAQSADFEAKADRLCERFESLLVLEQQVRSEIPQLASFPLTSETQQLLE